jgi:cytochrome P450
VELINLFNLLVTLAPLGMIHSTTEETQLCDVIIPKGSLIHANLCAAHNDPTVWKDGNDFIPERFISEDGSMKCFDSFLAFSHGKRRCPGESLARNELFLFLVGIIQNYRVEMSSNCSADFLLPNLGVSATPKPHHLEFYKR